MYSGKLIREVNGIRIEIGNFAFTEVWDGVLYKKLSHYPQISDWEIRTLIEFIDYEKQQGRVCEIVCEDKALRSQICESLADRRRYLQTPRPAVITACTACPYRKGCVTEYVCHTTSVENAIRILRCGKLLSAVKARGVPAEQLMQEKRNAAKDPADYFDYIMFSWGNCQAGDRLVMERKLGRFPDEKDLSSDFDPGIRFYFKYDRLIEHPNVIYDGVLPMKIRDALELDDWVFRIVIPKHLQDIVKDHIPAVLRDRVIYLENDCKDIWDWSEKVYCTIENDTTILPQEKYLCSR